MTVFIVALATLIVFDLGHSARLDQRISRSFSEGIQAEFTLKSAVNLGRVLLELPRNTEEDVDSQEEEWYRIGSIPTLPIEGVVGEARISVVDDDGKFNLNALSNPSKPVADFTRDFLSNLFSAYSFAQETYDAKLYRTPGNTGFAFADQVAAIIDWQDRDETSYQDPSFSGKGSESGAAKGFYYHRQLKSLNELLLVPGMTAERVSRIAPFVKVSKHQISRININTARPEVLQAMGFQEQEVQNIQDLRPINNAELNSFLAGKGLNNLASHLTVKSNEFSIYARVIMPSTTRWVYAKITAIGSPPSRRATVESMQFY